MVLELDMWPSPRSGDFLGLWLHGLTKKFKPVSVLLYCAPLATAHTAANQAQRIRWVFQTFLGQAVEEVVWATMNDNTGSAAN
eukprot:2727772-Lingulodinium_polyedra.AAC.1